MADAEATDTRPAGVPVVESVTDEAAPEQPAPRKSHVHHVLVGALVPAKVHRGPGAFPTNVPLSAQPTTASSSQTFLLVGVDSRSGLPTTGRDAKAHEWKYRAHRSDTMMLVDLPGDHSGAYVASLSRYAWVESPGVYP